MLSLRNSVTFLRRNNDHTILRKTDVTFLHNYYKNLTSYQRNPYLIYTLSQRSSDVVRMLSMHWVYSLRNNITLLRRNNDHVLLRKTEIIILQNYYVII